MSLLGFCQWLANTQWSVAIHDSPWAYPAIESVHVLTLCLFLGMVVILDLRLLGLALRRVSASEVLEQLFPWTVAGLALMVISGALLFFAIPVRTYQSIFFRGKMLMLALAGLNVWIFHSTIYRSVAEWGPDPVPPRRARVAGIISLVLWAGVVIAGRMIAYNWFDCDRQAPAIVHFIEGCTADSQ